MSQPRRLGRGLEALLGRPFRSSGEPELVAEDASASTSVPLELIDSNPFQPRTDFDPEELEQLAQSIRQHGLLQPLVVRRVGERYQLISGERRLRAAQQAGCTQVPVVVRQADDRQMAELALVENLQRKDLNPLEKAAAFQRYLQQYQCSQEELASRLGIHRSTVANLIRLLHLPQSVQQMLRQGELSMGHARALLTLGQEEQQLELARRVVREGLSVRAVERLVQEMQQASREEEPLLVVVDESSEESQSSLPDPGQQHLASLEQSLRMALGTRVEIRQKGPGRGCILIHFSSHEEFQRLHRYLCHDPQARSEAA